MRVTLHVDFELEVPDDTELSSICIDFGFGYDGVELTDLKNKLIDGHVIEHRSVNAEKNEEE